MKLSDEGKYKLTDNLSQYIPALDSTNKKDIKIINVLTHSARLNGWIPFYYKTFSHKYPYKLNPKIYSKKRSPEYPLQVADNLFITKSYRDSIYSRIYRSRLNKRKGYRYSDLGFYLFMEMVEKMTKTPLDKYVARNFFKPLGATTMGYNPLNKFDKQRIIPTENDKKFRKQLVQGYVHDYGAAMLGGVCGHAGLFASANDLAKIMQMYLQMGEYGGKRYINEETMRMFTSAPFKKKMHLRRGIG